MDALNGTASSVLHALVPRKLELPVHPGNRKWPYFHFHVRSAQQNEWSPNCSDLSIRACRQIWENYALDSYNEAQPNNTRTIFILGLMRLGNALPAISVHTMWQSRYLKEQDYLYSALALIRTKPLQADWLCSPACFGNNPTLLGRELLARALKTYSSRLANLILDLPPDIKEVDPIRLLGTIREIENEHF